jgi:nucleotide-binding universal stress UspA family protein
MRERLWQKGGAMIGFRRILCTTDLSGPSTRALTYAAAVARSYEAALTVLYVVATFDPVPASAGGPDGAVPMGYPASREEILGDVRRVVESAGAGSLDPALAAEAGDPFRTIVDQAVARSADLLVMGIHGRSGFERVVIGSVVEKVLRTAPCPVLTVPSEARGTVPAEVRFESVLCPMDFSPSARQAWRFGSRWIWPVGPTAP